MVELTWNSKAELSIPTQGLDKGESDPKKLQFHSKLDVDELDTETITNKLWKQIKDHPAIQSAVDEHDLMVSKS
jgi:hypothetical protein